MMQAEEKVSNMHLMMLFEHAMLCVTTDALLRQ